MKKGVRNLESRLFKNERKTLDELENENYLVFQNSNGLDGFICELSGECNAPSNSVENAPCEWLTKNGYCFGLDFYSLFKNINKELEKNGEYVDFGSIRTFNEKECLNELSDLLEAENCILQTWKYKESYIAPKPKKVFDYTDFYDSYVDGLEVFKPVDKVNMKRMAKIVDKIYDLCFQYIEFDITSDRRERAKERLKNIKQIKKARELAEYENKVWEAEIPESFFELTRDTVTTLAHSFCGGNRHWQALLKDIDENAFLERNLAYTAMKWNCKDSVDVICMLES